MLLPPMNEEREREKAKNELLSFHFIFGYSFVAFVRICHCCMQSAFSKLAADRPNRVFDLGRSVRLPPYRWYARAQPDQLNSDSDDFINSHFQGPHISARETEFINQDLLCVCFFFDFIVGICDDYYDLDYSVCMTYLWIYVVLTAFG